MAGGNQFSPVATDSIARIRDIAKRFSDHDLPVEAIDRLLSEVSLHEVTLRKSFEFRKDHGPRLTNADTDAKFSEKLAGLTSFARMAIDKGLRVDYERSKINENIDHYSFFVAKLTCAEWHPRSRRPVSEKAIRDASVEYSDALKRLANR